MANNMHYHLILMPLDGSDEAIKKFNKTFINKEYESPNERGSTDSLVVKDDQYYQHIVDFKMNSHGSAMDELIDTIHDCFPDITFWGILYALDRINWDSYLANIVIGRNGMLWYVNDVHEVNTVINEHQNFLFAPVGLTVMGVVNDDTQFSQIDIDSGDFGGHAQLWFPK